MTDVQPAAEIVAVPGQRVPALACPDWCAEHSRDDASPLRETQHRSTAIGVFVDFYEGDTYEVVLERWDEADTVASEHLELLRGDADTGERESVLHIPIGDFRRIAETVLGSSGGYPAT